MKVAIEKAEKGMILQEDVRLESQTMLAPEGTALTEKLIDTLKSKGIKEIAIAADEPSGHNAAAEHGADAADSADAAEESSETGNGITATISSDCMKATLSIDPARMSDRELCEKDIVGILNANGVVSGIQQNVIDEAVKKWKAEKKYYEWSGIAVGTQPTPGRDASLQFQVPCITDAGKLELARKARYAWELKPSGLKLHRVKTGDAIAQRGEPVPGTPGRNVLGAEVAAQEVKQAGFVYDESVELRADAGTVVALCDGVAYCVDEKIGVVPLSFDGSVEIVIAPDKMKADLIAHPAEGGGAGPSHDAVAQLLKEKNVVYGLNEKALADVEKQMRDGAYPEKPVCIAEGTPAVDGEDGKIEFLFDAETSLVPKKNADGSVDFKNINLIHPVTAGTELARRHEPTKAEPGSDVCGNALPGKDGADVQLPVGNGTAPSQEDADLLLAATDGNVRYDGKTVDVSEGYVVDGNVNFSTGNIQYNKAVAISGDVQSGFEVCCDGDLEVGGVVEDANVDVGCNVLVKAGFVGQGNGVITAGGDVNIGFVHSQTVRGGGNVTIAKEALDCTIFARKSVIILGEPTSTVGAHIIARDSIHVRSAGNMSGTKTELVAGVDYIVQQEIVNIDKQLDLHYENSEKLAKIIAGHEAILKKHKALPPQDEQLYGKVKETLARYKTEEAELKKKRKEMAAKQLDLSKAYIRVDHIIHPGTVIKIGEHQLHIEEELAGPKTARLIKGAIELV